MTLITFNSIPKNAIVTSTPIYDISMFRNACLKDEKINVTWGVLKPWLVSHAVSAFWWDLTETERRSILKPTIENTMFCVIATVGRGNLNCKGGVSFSKDIVCATNASLRVQVLGTPLADMTQCYYKCRKATKWTCVGEFSYNLPTYYLSIYSYEGTELRFAHGVAVIPVVKDYKSYKDLVIFQYDDYDIKIGNWQFPAHKYEKTKLVLREIRKYGDCYITQAFVIKEWVI